MKIRTETPSDRTRVREVVTGAFGSPEDADLVDALVRAGLDAARALGERTVTVLGHPTYHPRFDFERTGAHGVTCAVGAYRPE
ncbi:hypothetical protein [Streptomyces sp. NPDC047974]|uniref:hypothetical protein n=1 Tax=Streptomyces sp. NPDC047974 TaxID=3154343 RepID=UPI0033D3B3A7